MNNTESQTNGQNLIRSFIAVEMEEKIHAELAEIQLQLKKADAQVSWVKPQNIHCTFVFLGDIFANMINPVATALNQATAGCKPFEIEVNGLGFFGSPRAPRIIWAGIAGETALLAKLQNDIVNTVLATGLKPDLKPFKPHLTIGRVRSNRNAQALVAMIEKFSDKSFGKVFVERVVLMQSTLSAHGPEYSLLQAAALGAE